VASSDAATAKVRVRIPFCFYEEQLTPADSGISPISPAAFA
jgi:hypothetical protein